MTRQPMSDSPSDNVRRRRGGQVRPLAHRFWEKVRVSTGCWLWGASRDTKGYGSIGLFGRGTLARASRVAWLLSNGPIPAGQHVLHSCDNPPCVNPDHLFLGTNLDNAADMLAKGREAHLSGERNGRARLTRGQVAEIRHARAVGAGYRALAEQYGVSEGTIWWILSGRHWQ